MKDRSADNDADRTFKDHAFVISLKIFTFVIKERSVDYLEITKQLCFSPLTQWFLKTIANILTFTIEICMENICIFLFVP